MSIAYASEQLQQRFPDTGLAFARHAEALYREQAVENALQVLTEGVNRFPEYLPGRLVLARIYKETGRLTEAAAALGEVLERDANCPAALRLSAEISEGLRAYGESAKSFARLATHEPWDEEFQAWYQRALGLAGQGTAAFDATATPTSSIHEFNLNDVADFLPKEGGSETAFPAATQSTFAEVQPEAPPTGDAEAPVTGADVENRLDFLEQDSTTSETEDVPLLDPNPHATAIYTPPAAEEVPPESVLSEDMDRVEGSDIEKRLDDIFAEHQPSEAADGSDTAYAAAGDTHADPSETERVEGTDIEQRLEDVFAAPEPSASETTLGETGGTHFVPDTEPVQGSDIEKRLNDIFTQNQPAETTDTAFTAAADNTAAAPETERVEGADIEQRLEDVFAAPEPSASETTLSEAGGTHFVPDTEPVQGSDIEKRLDEIFAQHQPTDAADTHVAAPETERIEGADIEQRLHDVFSDAEPTASETTLAEAGDTHFLPDHERVQGSDIEKRLDDIFAQNQPSAVSDTAFAAAGDTRADSDTRSDLALDSAAPAAEEQEPEAAPAATAFQPEFTGMDDRTMVMPAFAPEAQEADESQATPTAETSATHHESVVETEDLRMIRETSAYELKGEEISEPVVVGDDISQRLDQLFGLNVPTAEVPAPPATEPETSETTAYKIEPAGSESDRDPSISGEDVQVRLTEMFGAEEMPADENEATRTQMLPRTREDEFSPPEENSATGEAVAPASDTSAPASEAMDEGEEAETAAAPPNVATMTLAEIYFQQGLKEQALQIYRQLLEREPDNETARKRVEEIEALKSDDEAQGSEADRRAPRPGLKVPRRKK